MIKKLLYKATGLKFSPVIGMSEQEPICSYNLSENTHEKLNEAALEVRIYGSDYDEIETLREKVKENICSKETESIIIIEMIIILIALSFLMLNFIRRRKNNER